VEVGFVGLGRMGRPMVERLLAAGHRVHVYNRSQTAAEELARAGAISESSASTVGLHSEAVMTALPSVDAVLSVYEQLGHVARNGQIFVDHSTVSIEVNRRCSELIEARGAHFLDAPVSGGPPGASTGTLTVMVGGNATAFEHMRPIFQAFGQNIRLCGPVGSGQAVKLVNQLLVGINTAAVAEAAVFGMKLGADPRVVLDMVGTSFGGSTMMTRNFPRFLSRDFAGATPVNLIVKDLGIIHEEARQNGAPLFLGGLAEQWFLTAEARGWGNEDMASIVKLWEEPAGVRLQDAAAI